jgi:hypothetical protein
VTRLRWEREEAPRSSHLYRDTAIFYAILAGLIVLVTALTGGNMFPGEVENKTRVLRFIGEIGAVPVAAAFFVLATAFSWWRLKKKERQEQQQKGRRGR